MIRNRLVWAAAVAVCGFAQQGVYEIQGRVVDADNGRPIPMARVHVQHMPAAGQRGGVIGGILPTGPGRGGNEQRLLAADASGSFRINNIPAGGVHLSCEKAGYISADSPKSSHLSVTLGKDTVLSPTLYLRRQAVIQGTVLNELGKAPGGLVFAYRLNLVNGRRVPQTASSSGIQPNGTFRILGLRPGNYYVSFQPNEFSESKRVYRTTMFPGTHDIASARTVKVVSGDEQHVEFRLVSEPGFQISGRIATASENFTISVVSAQPGFEERAVGSTNFNREDKTFRTSGLPSGTYKITAQVWDGASSRIATKRIELSGGNLSDIVLDPSLSNDVDVMLQSSDPKQRPYLQLLSNSETLSVYGNRDGKLTIRGGKPGIYALLPTRGRLAIQSARQGGRDALRDGVLVPEEGAADPLELTLVPQRQFLRGMIIKPQFDGREPIHFVMFRKTPVGLHVEAQQYFPATHIQERILPPLLPGEYIALAWTGPNEIPHLPYNEPGFLDRHNSAIERIVIGENGGEGQRFLIRKLLPATVWED